jgi:hypothetical protein
VLGKVHQRTSPRSSPLLQTEHQFRPDGDH